MPMRPPPKKRKTKTAAWRRLREVVLAEESFCGFCGMRVNKALPGTHDEGPQVGHIISVSERPDLELVRSNVRLEHKRCNLRRGS